MRYAEGKTWRDRWGRKGIDIMQGESTTAHGTRNGKDDTVDSTEKGFSQKNAKYSTHS